jgi:hypothetical protein
MSDLARIAANATAKATLSKRLLNPINKDNKLDKPNREDFINKNGNFIKDLFLNRTLFLGEEGYNLRGDLFLPLYKLNSALNSNMPRSSTLKSFTLTLS